MTNLENNDHEPYRPPIARGTNHYRTLPRELTTRRPLEPTTAKNDLFTIVINAVSEKGKVMNEQQSNERQFLVDLIFKPNEPGLTLRPAETQLLLAYIGEILKEIEEEEGQR